MANGHYWTQYDVDPTTGVEIPVSLREMAIREGKAPDFYIQKFGHTANAEIQTAYAAMNAPGRSDAAYIPALSHFAAEGVELTPGQMYTSFYSEDDRAYWERINSSSEYPGTGEGNLLVWHRQQSKERAPAFARKA